MILSILSLNTPSFIAAAGRQSRSRGCDVVTVGRDSAGEELVYLDEAPDYENLNPSPSARFACLPPSPKLSRDRLRLDRDISPAPSLKMPMMMIAVGFHAALRDYSRPCVRRGSAKSSHHFLGAFYSSLVIFLPEFYRKYYPRSSVTIVVSDMLKIFNRYMWFIFT